MIFLVLNPDNSIKTALHGSCGAPTEPHAVVDDAAWATVSVYRNH